MHDVAPSAVTIAVAIDAIICTMNLMVSLFVIVFNFLPFQLFTFKRWGFRPARLISISRYITRWLGVSAAIATTVLITALGILDVAAVGAPAS